MYPIKVTQQLELVHMDFLAVEFGKINKDVNILVVMDHFTKYSQAYVTSSQTVQVVVKTLWEKFLCIMGCKRNYWVTKTGILQVSWYQNYVQ